MKRSGGLTIMKLPMDTRVFAPASLGRCVPGMLCPERCPEIRPSSRSSIDRIPGICQRGSTELLSHSHIRQHSPCDTLPINVQFVYYVFGGG